MTLTQLSSLARQAAAIAAVVIGALPSIPVSSGVHATLVGGGAALLTIEHLVSSLAEKFTTKSTTTEAK